MTHPVLSLYPFLHAIDAKGDSAVDPVRLVAAIDSSRSTAGHPPEPLHGLDIAVALVTDVAEQSGCCRRDHGHYRVHSGNEQRFVPSPVARRPWGRSRETRRTSVDAS